MAQLPFLQRGITQTMGGFGKHHEEQRAQQCQHAGQSLAHQRQDVPIITSSRDPHHGVARGDGKLSALDIREFRNGKPKSMAISARASVCKCLVHSMSKPGLTCRITANPIVREQGVRRGTVWLTGNHICNGAPFQLLLTGPDSHGGWAVAFFNTGGPTARSPAKHDGGLRIYTKPPECDKSFSLGN